MAYFKIFQQRAPLVVASASGKKNPLGENFAQDSYKANLSMIGWAEADDAHEALTRAKQIHPWLRWPMVEETKHRKRFWS